MISYHWLMISSAGFVNHIERLFDEKVLIGTGWTAHESMRPLAYSTLADLVHHVRTSLPMSDLALAVDLFSKNIHDDSLPSSIQTMSCKLLLNLVESIRTKSDQENGNVSAGPVLPPSFPSSSLSTLMSLWLQGRELLMHMLNVYVLKFKSIAQQQLPAMLARWWVPLQTLVHLQFPSDCIHIFHLSASR